MTNEITINLETLAWLAGFIIAVGGALAYMAKWAQPVTRPYKELRQNVSMLVERKTACDQKFEHDQAQLARLEKNDKMIMTTQMLILKHLETGNCTGEIAEGRAALEKYLIDKN